MEFRITFAVLGGEYDGTVVDLARVEDASAEVADEARQLDPAATVSVQPGSTGKGAGGPGIELVLHVMEEVLNDGASVFPGDDSLGGHRPGQKLVRRAGSASSSWLRVPGSGRVARTALGNRGRAGMNLAPDRLSRRS